MSETDKSPEELLDLFGDDLARKILLLTSDAQMSAAAMAAELNVSRPTVYRRVNTLVEYDLLQKEIETDSDGHHYRTFELTLNEITFRIDGGELGIVVDVDEGLVDRFDGLLDLLEASYSHVHVGTTGPSDLPQSGVDPDYG